MNMMIVEYRTEYENELLNFWNHVAVAQGYVQMDLKAFRAAITEHPYHRPEHMYLAMSGNVCKGFACGCSGADLPYGDRRGYLTCLILEPEQETGQGDDGRDAMWDSDIGPSLMKSLEASMVVKGLSEVAVNCFNPMKLSWRIQGDCLHNNCPGVAMDLEIYSLLTGLGYETMHEECAMFLDLLNYQEDADWAAETTERVARDGYSVEWYRTGVHRELKSMVDSLNNSMWSAEIPEAAENINMLVALKGDTIVGFTGPVYPEVSGRGYFAGIAVSAGHEKHGLGTMLFLKLLAEEKKCGSSYMSLFTGTDNNARRIYERAGFTVKRRFATMLKQL